VLRRRLPLDTCNLRLVRSSRLSQLCLAGCLTLGVGREVCFVAFVGLGDPLRVPPPGHRLVTAQEMQACLSAQLGIPELFTEALMASSAAPGNGPARVFRLPKAIGTLGFITPVSQHFCPACNRLRLTADGKLRPCLLSEGEVDVMTALRSNAGEAEVQALFARAVENKPERHRFMRRSRRPS